MLLGLPMAKNVIPCRGWFADLLVECKSVVVVLCKSVATDFFFKVTPAYLDILVFFGVEDIPYFKIIARYLSEESLYCLYKVVSLNFSV